MSQLKPPKLITGLFRWTPCGCWVYIGNGRVSTVHLVRPRVYG